LDVFYSYLFWAVDWINPWFLITLGALLFFMTLIGFSPLQPAEGAGASEVFLANLRRVLISVFLTVLGVFPFSIFAISFLLFRGAAKPVFDAIGAEFVLNFSQFWTAPVAGVLLGFLVSFCYSRYLLPRSSAFFRRFRVRQSGDELSDIRAEKERFSPKEFLPRRFYKKGLFFYGLDENNDPVYVPDEVWKTQNQKIIGPTQTGKGVNLGVQIDQAIRKGMTVIAIDPKPDKHLPHIMAQACRDAGREFIYLDLNDENGPGWAPFLGGTPRDRRNRVLYAFGLTDTGSESDFYKVKEREIIDRILPQWDGHLETLSATLHHPDYLEDTKRTRGYLNEWLFVRSFAPEKGLGVSIEKVLEENAVLYVRGSLKDSTVIKGATVFIMEVVQELMRLYSDGRRQDHLYFVIDEVRFMISDMLADALATVVGFDANIAIAYQSTLDIRNLKDQTLNAGAIEQSININCKTTLCYMAMDTETAQWASELSGTRLKSVTRMEGVKVLRHGGEIWDDKRMMNKVEECFIPANTFRMLPERTGVLFMPTELARVIYTCWVPAEEEFSPTLPEVKKVDETPVEIERQAAGLSGENSLPETTVNVAVVAAESELEGLDLGEMGQEKSSGKRHQKEEILSEEDLLKIE